MLVRYNGRLSDKLDALVDNHNDRLKRFLCKHAPVNNKIFAQRTSVNLINEQLNNYRPQTCQRCTSYRDKGPRQKCVHSIETAVVLVVLDLSAGFDTVDLHIMPLFVHISLHGCSMYPSKMFCKKYVLAV